MLSTIALESTGGRSVKAQVKTAFAHPLGSNRTWQLGFSVACDRGSSHAQPSPVHEIKACANSSARTTLGTKTEVLAPDNMVRL